MRIKNIAASIGTALLLVSNCVPIISSAAPEQPSISSATTSDSSTTTATTTSVITTKPSTDIDWEQLRDEYQEAIKNELEQQKNPEDLQMAQPLISEPVSTYFYPYCSPSLRRLAIYLLSVML